MHCGLYNQAGTLHDKTFGDLAIKYGGKALQAHSDADFCNDEAQSCPTTGTVLIFNGTII